MSKSIKTNWIVLTGPPCSGKTTILNRLNEAGYNTSDDISRKIIGHNNDLRKDPELLQSTILRAMLETEKVLNPLDLVILDYALPDMVAFCKVEGVSPEGSNIASTLYKYREVIIFSPLPMKNDIVRNETAKYQNMILKELENTYSGIGYSYYCLGVDTIDNRLKTVLKIISSNKSE